MTRTPGELRGAIDTLLDEYADRFGYAETELVLQERAQDFRELAYEHGEREAITAEDFEGWTGE